MPRWIFPSIILIILLTLIDWYVYQAIKLVFKEKIYRNIWIIIHILIYGYVIYSFVVLPANSTQTPKFQSIIGILLTVLIPKLVVVLFLFGEDIYRFLKKITLNIFTDKKVDLSSRREFVSKLALGMAFIPLSGFIYGILKGKYNYKVIKYTLTFKDLPSSFDGYKITHISDIHSGSFDNKEKIEYGVDLINQQESDILLFTGDIVNNFASEMLPWMDTFKKLKAKDGKFSVLGNHDYGDYSKWDNLKDKQENFEAIKKIHKDLNFRLLLDESVSLNKNKDKLHLVGVQNWGRGFHKVGDLEKAGKLINKEDFKILLSHDPSHWDEIVKNHSKNYQLTLSGHTHGLQMGIEIPGWIKWSPSQLMYKQWAGLYKEKNRFINVNRGFGFHAFPGRVGIWPEITVIELKKEE